MPATTGARYRDSIPATWLADRFAVDPANIDEMRRGVARVVAAAREAGIDEARLYDVLTAPLGLRESGRRRLADLLLEGREDEVVAAVRAA